ncbi:protein dispatched homolog 1-like [Pecten maximus]|uniref:protein dispatched homolog 1-like n=1 Tax=Pecten maximus TaxID=6579 RepID=UPI001458AA10|nr:protein dispatched homolog 1-like [Pecten maximus]XP_033734466.1 protein dispatched homolog 1-like [Pecten maximus]
MSYVRVLAHYPYVVLLAVFVVVATCLILSTTVIQLPDFGDPMAGFEPRGTDLGERLVTFHNVMYNPNNKLSLLPFGAGFEDQIEDQITDKTDNDTELWDEQGYVKRSTKRTTLCNLPDKDYRGLARIVFRSKDGSNLFSADKIRHMCRVEEERIHTHPTYPGMCLRANDDSCCRSWSLGNYIAFLTGHENCSEIRDEDVSKVGRLLQSCAPFYHNYTLKHNCDTLKRGAKRYICQNMPKKCMRLNTVYDIFHYIADVEFLPANNKVSRPVLSWAVTFLPVYAKENTVELYKHMEEWTESLEEVQIVGVNFGIKYVLFSEYLMSDTVWLVSAACVIFLIIWLYCASLFITIMTFLMMFWSLELAYFIYMLVFEIKFFPYMNLVTVIIVIAIGADDVFIYSKVWHLAKSEPNNGTLEKIVSNTLKHATLSMFVTSFTTAAALFTTTISSITAIKCFSIYAGLTVVCNFVLVVTWLPASIIIHDKWCNCEAWYNPEFLTNKGICYYMCIVPYKVHDQFSEWSKILFEKVVPFIMIKLRILWIVLLGGIGIGGIIVIFFYPKLKLPSSEKFQVFSSDHLFEHYDFVLNSKFWFEREHTEHRSLLPLTIVWGVLPIDNGNSLDPYDKGDLKFDYSFNPLTSNAQKWFLNFCKKIRQTDFYFDLPGFQFTNCMFEDFQALMKRPCIDYMQGIDHSPCCNATESQPLSSTSMLQCLTEYIPVLRTTPGVRYNFYTPGLRFYNGRICAFIVQFLSNETFSFAYDRINVFYKKVNSWVKQELSTAPPEIKNGWFISDFEFYDLQNSLLGETPLAFGVSLAVVSVVAFLTTLNLLISFLAILSIAFVMFTTVAALVLLGWDLNILESVVVTVAIGMSIDYTLHYGVSYQLCPDFDRKTRVSTSVARLGNVISMAALTTFLAGAMMMPSTVLVYQKFGIFLMLIISISWTYSTFFFQGLLCVCGPTKGFTQLHWPSSECCSNSVPDRRDKTRYSTSESTMSTSSSYHHTTSSESHEMEPLTDDYRRRYSSRSRPSYSRTIMAADYSPEHPRRGSHVRFSIDSVDKSVSVFDPEDELAHAQRCRSRAESEVFLEDEELESPTNETNDKHKDSGS